VIGKELIMHVDVVSSFGDFFFKGRLWDDCYVDLQQEGQLFKEGLGRAKHVSTNAISTSI